MAYTKNKITITVEAEAEDETPEQSERRTGSMKGYAKAVRENMRKAEGRWGWCSVKVTATIHSKPTQFGTNYLGNCSYLNAQDFIKNSGYFQQMVDEAIAEALEVRHA